jgi:hypothetical protein
MNKKPVSNSMAIGASNECQTEVHQGQTVDQADEIFFPNDLIVKITYSATVKLTAVLSFSG